MFVCSGMVRFGGNSLHPPILEEFYYFASAKLRSISRGYFLWKSKSVNNVPSYEAYDFLFSDLAECASFYTYGEIVYSL